MRHVEQQSHGSQNTLHLTTFKNRASLLRGHKTVQNVRNNVRALHCDNLDRIRSRASPLFGRDLMRPLKRMQRMRDIVQRMQSVVRG